MKNEEIKNKNKEGIANFLLLVAVCLIFGGFYLGVSNMEENLKTAFFMCLTGTALSFISNYIKVGYFKFFN